MDHHYPIAPKKFTFKLKKCKCNCHEEMVRKCLKKIGDTKLISINLENNTYTVSTIKSPAHVVQALQNLLHIGIEILPQKESPRAKSTVVGSSDMITVSDTGKEIVIRLNIPKDGSGANYGYAKNGGHVRAIDYALPTQPQPRRSFKPSTVPVMSNENPTAPPAPYSYYGFSTSSDDYPKDYPCTVL